MNDAAALQHVKQIFSDYWDAGTYPILFGNPADAGVPVDPVADRTSGTFPARFLSAIDEVESEELVTGTTVEVRGAWAVVVWAEKGAEEEAIAALHTLLREMFRLHGDATGIQFFPARKGDAEEASEDAPWFGRPLHFPYVRFQEVA